MRCSVNELNSFRQILSNKRGSLQNCMRTSVFIGCLYVRAADFRVTLMSWLPYFQVALMSRAVNNSRLPGLRTHLIS